MDDSSLLTDNELDSPMLLGLQAFGAEERSQFGQDVRLAMACIEGAAAPVSTKAMPSDEVEYRKINRLSPPSRHTKIPTATIF